MTTTIEIGQPTFIEVIKVDPYTVIKCVSNTIVGASRWQNPTNRFDVDGDGEVTIDDYNLLLEWIANIGQDGYTSQLLPRAKPDSAPYVDINGDGRLTSIDVQQLSTYINTGKVIDRTTPTDCYSATGFEMQRDLLDPSRFSTVKSAALSKGVIIDYYTPFSRNFSTGRLESIDYSSSIETKYSLVFIHVDLLIEPTGINSGCSSASPLIGRVERRLAATREILPSRFVWPIQQ